MSLAGNLRTMALPDILQWISMGRKTGTLHLERRSIHKRIMFQSGSISTSSSNDPREYLGQYLMRAGKVSEEQLFRALLKQENQGKLIGAVLIDEGLLTEQDLRLALRTKAEETVYDLFLWPEGKFEFKDGELPSNVPVHIESEVTSLILEGIRRVDEWGRIQEVFPNLTTTFKVVKPTDTVTDPWERKFLEVAATGKSIAEITLESRRSEFDTATALYDLYQRGFIKVDRVEEDAWGSDPVGAIQDLLSVAQQRLAEKRFDAALEAYEQVLCFDRLNQHAKKGLIAVIDARDRERAMRTVPLDKVPVLKMDLLTLTKENFDAQEGFVLSRVNGQSDVKSLLQLCPMPEEAALVIFARLLKRKVIEMV